MRLIATLSDQKKGQTLSAYLKQIGIDNQIEMAPNTDWGSSDYGTITCRIWVYEEDLFQKALSIAHEYTQSPDDPKYQIDEKRLQYMLQPVQEKAKEPPLLARQLRRPILPWNRDPLGAITFYILITCSVLLVFTDFITAPDVKNAPSSLPYASVYDSPLEKELLFDYPAAFGYVDQLIQEYGLAKLQNLNDLPAEGKELLQKFYSTPYWKGLYAMAVEHFKHPDASWSFNAPMFEKISQGQVWRIISPSFLHDGVLHLLFNMIWLLILGRQMEARIGKGRYILFIFLTGVITNVFQYLVSGFNFLGFSGILCAMATFIWIRQKKAAWEGYHLQPATFGFLLFFIFTMAAIQAGSFYTEIVASSSFNLPIANTAHMTGLAAGLVLGLSNYFSWKTS